jgi:hypothetical protein
MIEIIFHLFVTFWDSKFIRISLFPKPYFGIGGPVVEQSAPDRVGAGSSPTGVAFFFSFVHEKGPSSCHTSSVSSAPPDSKVKSSE